MSNKSPRLVLLVTNGYAFDVIEETQSIYSHDEIKCWDFLENVKKTSIIYNLFEKQPDLHKPICALVISTGEWVVDTVDHELDPSMCYFTEWFYVPQHFYKD